MAKLVITTLELPEAKALLKLLPKPEHPPIGITPQYVEAHRKLTKAVQHADPEWKVPS
jgi:hypothetical protein